MGQLTTITNRIYELARCQPTKTAVIHNDTPLSYAAFSRTIDVSCRFLEQQKLPVGRTAIVLSNNILDCWMTVIALRTIGLNTIVIQSIAQVADLKLRDVVCVVFTEPQQCAHNLNTNTLTGAKVITVPSAIDAHIHEGDVPLGQQGSPFGGHILYTSGTTGAYKKLLLDGAHEYRRNAKRASALSFGKNTVHHGVDYGPWTTVGFRYPSAVWHAGGCVVFDMRQEKFNKFFRHAINHSCLTPPMVKELVESPNVSRSSHSEFSLAVTAGFLPITLAEMAVHKLTKEVRILYGSSELGTPAMHSRFEIKDDLHWLTIADDRTVQIIDENGNNCSTGDEGELRILITDIDCTSYLDDIEASEMAFRDGFFYPGDMAVRRADGRIRVLGRAADVLNLQGRKIAVAPIEQEIQHRLRVDEVCLFSGLNDAAKEVLVIAIQSNRTLQKSDLDAIACKFPSFAEVHFKVLKEFPRTETGTRKTRRPVLRKLVFPQSA
jgi:acyl-coenzyme A synthetase/AMP-(fatty) acid ligase